MALSQNEIQELYSHHGKGMEFVVRVNNDIINKGLQHLAPHELQQYRMLHPESGLPANIGELKQIADSVESHWRQRRQQERVQREEKDAHDAKKRQDKLGHAVDAFGRPVYGPQTSPAGKETITPQDEAKTEAASQNTATQSEGGQPAADQPPGAQPPLAIPPAAQNTPPVTTPATEGVIATAPAAVTPPAVTPATAKDATAAYVANLRAQAQLPKPPANQSATQAVEELHKEREQRAQAFGDYSLNMQRQVDAKRTQEDVEKKRRDAIAKRRTELRERLKAERAALEKKLRDDPRYKETENAMQADMREKYDVLQKETMRKRRTADNVQFKGKTWKDPTGNVYDEALIRENEYIGTVDRNGKRNENPISQLRRDTADAFKKRYGYSWNFGRRGHDKAVYFDKKFMGWQHIEEIPEHANIPQANLDTAFLTKYKADQGVQQTITKLEGIDKKLANPYLAEYGAFGLSKADIPQELWVDFADLFEPGESSSALLSQTEMPIQNQEEEQQESRDHSGSHGHQNLNRRGIERITGNESPQEIPEKPRLRRPTSYNRHPMSSRYQPRFNPERGGRMAGKTAARAGRAAGRAGGQIAKTAGRAAAQVARSLFTALFLTPPYVGWIIIGVVLAILLIVAFYILFFGHIQNADLTNPRSYTANDIAFTKEGPAAVDNKQAIDYRITASFPGLADKMVITDKIPDGTKFQGTTCNGIYNDSTRIVTWTIPGTNPGALENINCILTVSPQINDTYVFNIANIEIAGVGNPANGSTAPSPGGTGSLPPNPGTNPQPNSETCGGRWTISGGSHNGKNFGDPGCELAKSPIIENYPGSWSDRWPKDPEQYLVELIKQLDQSNEQHWVGIAACESHFDPNAFAGNSASGKGAFGLMQMNPTGSGNGPTDAGDVNWRQQVTNAVNYEQMLNAIGKSWRYWDCARQVFSLW